MNQETWERIDAIAARLGVAGEHLWAVLVRQQYITAIVDTCYLLVLGFAFYRLAKFVAPRWEEWDTEYGGFKQVAAGVSLIVGGLLVLILALVVPGEIATAILNPEAGAIKWLASQFKD